MSCRPIEVYALSAVIVSCLIAGCVSASSTSGDRSAADAAAAAAGATGGAAKGGNADISVTENPDGSRTWNVKSGGGSSEATAAAQAAAEAAARAEANSKANGKAVDALAWAVYVVLAWIGLKILLSSLVSLGWLAKNPLA
jgi:hypothetical protein